MNPKARCDQCRKAIKYRAEPEPYWLQIWVKGSSGGRSPHYFMNAEPGVLCSRACARLWFEHAIEP